MAPEQGSALKNILFRAAAVLLGCAIGFLLSEIAVRAFLPQNTGPVQYSYDPQLGEIPVPLQRARRTYASVYAYTSTHDASGRRVTGYTDPKGARFRIVLLGDSFTYGTGVNDDETFAYLLEKDSGAAGRPIQVVNAGNPGKATDYELKWFETAGYKLHPDLTVLCFFSNDFGENQRGEYYRLDRDGKPVAKPLSPLFSPWEMSLRRSSAYNWLLAHSQVVNLLRNAMFWRFRRQQAVAKGLIVVTPVDARGNYANEENKKLTDVYLSYLERAVEESGSGLLVFYLPRRQEVQSYRERRQLSEDERTLGLLSKSHNLDLVSLTPALADSGLPVEKLYYLEGHWTAAGHALAAKVMFPEIEKRLSPKQ